MTLPCPPNHDEDTPLLGSTPSTISSSATASEPDLSSVQRRVSFRPKVLTHEEFQNSMLTATTTGTEEMSSAENQKAENTLYQEFHSVIQRIQRIPWSQYAIPLWRGLFAALAIADAVTCWPVWIQGWTLVEQEQALKENHKANIWDVLFQQHRNHTHQEEFQTCPNQYEYFQLYGYQIKQWIAMLFCLACLIEALLRAHEAQAMAIQMAALDQLEKRLTRAYSTTRMSFVGSFRIATTSNKNQDETMDEILARSTIRTWIPVISVLAFWLTLLPLRTTRPFQEYNCGQDQALATMWITHSYQQFTAFAEWAQEQASTIFWKVAMPYNVLQPQRFMNRVHQILRLIRYIRFAGPLGRMCLKLGDQIFNLMGTWRQQMAARLEKAKRIARPSILFSDIKKIESLTKVQTALARIPSQMILMAQEQMASPTVFGRRNSLEETRARGQKWKGEIEELKLDLHHRHSLNESVADLYDRFVKLSKELQANLNDTVLSSSKHLISPHSRFGLIWRITVTNCFLLELGRLTMSWHLSGTFKSSFRRIISKMLVECEASVVKKKVSLNFLHNAARDIHQHLSNLVPILPPPEEEFTTCMPTSTTSMLFLEVGSGIQHFIDLVGFIDIFIWFFTGELDVNGLVQPKPFFYRCILPGTLSQVLDHPTLPDILPALTARFLDAAATVGWSRMIRWYLAIIPAFITLIIDPLEAYFIGTVDSEKDGMIHVAESVGVLAPIPRNASVPFQLGHGFSNPRLTSESSEVGLFISTKSFDVSEREVEDDDDEPISVENNLLPPDLPSPRPLWSRKIVDLDDEPDDSYSFDYTALPIAY